MKNRGEYDSSREYEPLDLVAAGSIYMCRKTCTGVPVTDEEYWEVFIDLSGILGRLEALENS